MALKNLNKIMIESACKIASKIQAKAVFIYADVFDDLESIKAVSKKNKIIFFTKKKTNLINLEGISKNILTIPDVNLSRLGKIKIAVMKGLAEGWIKKEDRIVCLSGISTLGRLDNLLVLDIGKEFETLTAYNIPDILDTLKKDVFEVLLNLSIELANEGREGKPMGAIFVIGDTEKVLQLSRQLIINPFKGYAEEERNILDQNLKETIKEFSSLDGAFIVRDDGIIVSAGRYLNAALEEADFPQGLGSRHMAAAGITAVSDAIAITISESDGTVRIFRKGAIFIEIEKPPKLNL